MNAAVYEGIEKIIMREMEEPVCSEDSIVVRVKSCAICGTDLRTFHHGKSNVNPPQVLGHEIAGVIEKAGRKVTGFSEGDRVSVAAIVSCDRCYYCRMGRANLCESFAAIGYEYPGGFAEKLGVPAQMLKDGSVNRIGDNLSFDEASIAEPFACAINGQELSRVAQGDNVVVVGAGPVGCMHLELARARGAGKVIIADLIESRLAMARDFNADVCINPEKEDMVSRVLSETGSRGADVVIVAAPSGKAQEEALSMVAPFGRINFFGGLPKDNSYVRLDSNLIHYKEISISGTSGSLPRHNQEALRLFSSGEVSAGKFITHTFPLEEILEGFRIVESGEGCKVVINP